MKMIHNLLWIAAFGFAQAACTDGIVIAAIPDGGNDSGNGSNDAAPDAGSGDDGMATGACSSDADCSAHQVCGFLESLACAARGQCFAAPGAVCAAYSAGCACDGSEISVACTGLPDGYASKPLSHTGPCIDAGNATDSGVATGACSSDADCAANQICGFLESLACTAQGQCFAAPGAVCQAYSPGCACDGTDINVACTGLPTGYASKTLAHTGPCIDAGQGSDSGISCNATLGAHCGGNTTHPCTCAPGLVCTPGDGGLPFGDVGGTCQPSNGSLPATCVTNVDCGSSGLCGFASSAACMAQGKCFPAPGSACKAYAAGCACDHTQINIGCTGLPGGYEVKPLLHQGACTDGGDGG